MATAEVALSVLLLTGAMLLILSLAALEHVNPGFNPQNLSTFHLWLPAQRFKTATATWDFEHRVLVRLSGLPGVESSAVVSALPLEFGVNGTTRVTSRGHESHVYVEIRGASPDYFKTMQIPLVRGRGFQSSDTASAPLVAVVNEAFARKCCADGETLGSQETLPVGWEGGLRREIVGVVGDAKEHGISEPAPPTLFLPAAQLDDKLVRAVFSGSSWVVRSQAPLGENEVRRAVAQADSGEAVGDFASMAALVEESFAPSRFMARLMSAFAGLALLLAAIGLYGVLSYSVAERTHEIGLRMALGAERRDVLGMVLGQGLRVALVGVAIGLALALALSRLLGDLLFGVRPTDPGAIAGVAAIVSVVALIACYVPARRATKVDPMVALRYE